MRLTDELPPGRQRVLPNKALSRGFVFRHEMLRSGFEAMLQDFRPRPDF